MALPTRGRAKAGLCVSRPPTSRRSAGQSGGLLLLQRLCGAASCQNLGWCRKEGLPGPPAGVSPAGGVLVLCADLIICPDLIILVLILTMPRSTEKCLRF